MNTAAYQNENQLMELAILKTNKPKRLSKEPDKRQESKPGNPLERNHSQYDGNNQCRQSRSLITHVLLNNQMEPITRHFSDVALWCLKKAMPRK